MKDKKKNQFKVDQKIFCPTHGVGTVSEISSEIYNYDNYDLKLEVYIIFFEHSQMKLYVPFDKIAEFGIRSLSTPETIKKALSMLRQPTKTIKGFSAKKIPESQVKINSGSPFLLVDAIKELYPSYKNGSSYREKILYDSGIKKIAQEVSSVLDISIYEAYQSINLALRAAYGDKVNKIELSSELSKDDDFDDPEFSSEEDLTQEAQLSKDTSAKKKLSNSI